MMCEMMTKPGKTNKYAFTPAKLGVKDGEQDERTSVRSLDRESADDAHFTLFYSPPYNDLNPLIVQCFASNIFSELAAPATACKPTYLVAHFRMFVT